jgi:AraC-like DNA-binding protein
MVLITIVLAVLYSIPLLIKRDVVKSDLILCAFLLSQGLIALNIVFLFNETLGPQTAQILAPYHKVPLTILYGIQGFLLLWYSRAMMGMSLQFLSTSTILGFVVILGIVIQGISNNSGDVNHTKHYFPVIGIVLLLSIISGIYALSRLRHYDNKIRGRFSNIENIRLSWLWFCALGFVCVWITVLTSGLFGWLGFYGISNQLGTFSNLPPMLLMSIMVVYSQTFPTLTKNSNALKQSQIEKEDKLFNASDEQKSKLDDLMLRVKIYQDPELRLDGLADCMKMSPRSVSALLNGHYQKNFYDFVNYYRVLDAQEQLRNIRTKDKTIQRIFEDAGFNSKTTFNTLFKKLTGHTPSEYRRMAMLAEE